MRSRIARIAARKLAFSSVGDLVDCRKAAFEGFRDLRVVYTARRALYFPAIERARS